MRAKERVTPLMGKKPGTQADRQTCKAVKVRYTEVKKVKSPEVKNR